MPSRILSLLKSDSDLEFFVKISIWFVALLTPINGVMGALIMLITIDFVTGIVASFKLGRKIRASAMVNTVHKFLIYLLVTLAAHITEVEVIPELPIMKVTSGFIALVELRSIYENFNEIFGLDIWKYIKNVLNKKDIDSLIPDQDDRERKK